MMDHILASVEELVAQEHKAIVTKHGDGYNSAHEAYAVLLEEEVADLVNQIFVRK